MQASKAVPVLLLAAFGIAGFLWWSSGGDGATPPAVPGGDYEAQEAAEDRLAPAELEAGGAPAEAAPAATARRAVTSEEATEQEEVAASLSLTGRLVLGGAPISGVQIRYSAFPRGDRITRLLRGASGDPVWQGEEATTGADGRFSFAVRPRSAGQLLLTPGEFVFADAEGHPVAIESADVDLGEIAISRGGVLAGRVVDAGGRALEGVEVSLSRGGEVAVLAGFSRWSTTTEADGRFEFQGLHAADYRVTTASPQHLPADERVTVEAGMRTDGLLLTLQGGASISGRVVDDLGQPVAGASVGLYRERQVDGSMKVRGLAQGESVETDANGIFTLGGIEDDTVSVRARRDGYRTVDQPSVAVGTANLEMVLSRNGTITGRLVDSQGRGIAGSEIAVSGQRRSDIRMLMRDAEITAADGSFEIEDVSAGELTVEASGKMHLPVKTSVTVRPGETTDELRLVAERGAMVEAWVVDHRGNPVPNAVVEVTEPRNAPPSADGEFRFEMRSVRRRVGNGEDHTEIEDGSGGRVLGEATTDSEGRALVGGLPAGDVEVRAMHQELAPSAAERLSLALSTTSEARLALVPGGAVEFTVVDDANAPMAEVALAINGPQGGTGQSEARDATTASDGTARLAALPAGLYTAVIKSKPRPITMGGASIMIAGASGAELDDSLVEFMVRPGETAKATLIHPTLTTFAGLLLDASGPVARGRVNLSRKGAETLAMPGLGGGYSGTTDANGRFSIDDLPAGDYSIEYGRKGQLVMAKDEIQLSGERLVERQLLLTGGVVVVQVFDSEQDPLRNAKVTLQRQDASGSAPRPRMQMISMVQINNGGNEQSMEIGGDPYAQTDEEGVARLEDVPPGAYTVTITHPRHMEQQVENVEVIADEELRLDTVEMQAGGNLRGSVATAEGDAPTVANVEISRVGDADTETTVAMQGAFNFSGIEPGTYSVRAQSLNGGQGDWGPAETVEVRAGRTARTKVRLP